MISIKGLKVQLTHGHVNSNNENLIIIIFGLLTKREVKMAGYWPSSFFCVFMRDRGP